MAIKQIQLRGISRTPSDRLTNDGGCAESLNVQLDNTELAPMFYPEDVTTKLGLPENLEAKRIFIHKTANYENYIAVQSDRVVAYTPGIEDDEPLLILELAKGESVNDITSVGNMLVFTTTKDMYYSLYNERKFTFLGNKTPFPYIRFNAINNDDFTVSGYFQPYSIADSKENIAKEWNKTDNSGENTNEEVLEHLGRFWDAYDNIYNAAGQKVEDFASPMIARYALELYDGSLLSSMPILVNPEQLDIWAQAMHMKGMERNPYDELVAFESSSLRFTTSDFYVKATIENNIDWERWKKLVKSINIYMSRPYKDFANRRASSIHNVNTEYYENGYGEYWTTTTADVHVTEIIEQGLLLQSSQCYLIKKIDIYDEHGNYTKDYEDLTRGIEIRKADFPEGSLEDSLLLIKDDMKHYAQTTDAIDVYNNKLLLLQPSQVIDYDYNRLNAYQITEATSSTRNKELTLDVTYLLMGYTEDKVINKSFTYYENSNGLEKVYAFQVFPDSRAYKMIVKATTTTDDYSTVKYGEFDMHPHPYLDCAYYYGDIWNELVNLCTLDSAADYPTKANDDLDHKIFVSEQDDPLVFPLESRYTFQSKVVGVAIATVGLSQGQFGQFPLYVFTEDGIWAMETGADGSFVSQKPLSREVCINPDSITSLDNAVAFVTAQGVMLLQGSQVTNISPFMNGKHYDVEESAKIIINGQKDFKHFVPIIDDETHFLAFMKESKIAYDYAGKRLVFIKEGEQYQYIYKLDTQTWHKSAYGMNLIAPINSYPECLVQGKGGERTVVEWSVTKYGSQEEMDYLAGRIRTILPDISDDEVARFFFKESAIDVSEISEDGREWLYNEMDYYHVATAFTTTIVRATRVYDLSTILDAAESKTPTKGVIVTRPIDLGEPDVFKTIVDVRIRGQFPKGAVKFILLGSNDGIHFTAMSTLRGRSWKLFRIIILADLQPTDRISWIDVQYENRFTNRLR